MGKDEMDATSVAAPVPVLPEKARLDGLRVGIPQAYFGEGLDADVRERVMDAAHELERLGATLVEVDMPILKYSIPAYYILACAEASSNLSRYDGVKYGFRPAHFEDLHDLYLTARSEGFGAEVKRRIMLGAFALSSGEPMTEFNTSVATWNPRCAIGYYEPGHYCLVVVDGRQRGYSLGLEMTELSKLMKQLGCTEAYNLDGGMTAMMAYGTELYSQPCGGGRQNCDIVYVAEPLS